MRLMNLLKHMLFLSLWPIYNVEHLNLFSVYKLFHFLHQSTWYEVNIACILHTYCIHIDVLRCIISPWLNFSYWASHISIAYQPVLYHSILDCYVLWYPEREVKLFALVTRFYEFTTLILSSSSSLSLSLFPFLTLHIYTYI